MIDTIRRFIQNKELILPGQHVLAGVSGGADSVCLLLVLKELSQTFPFTLSAIHVEHGIRGQESCEDADFVMELCRRQEIPCRMIRLEVLSQAAQLHLGLEEAARLLRYRAFEEEAARIGADRIAIAHHRGDAAETVLFHLCRGTGIQGMAGIPAKRGPIIRPLLCVSREMIEQYLKEQDQAYRIDSTNEDTAYARNRIRHCILPQMEKINSSAQEHIVQMADQLGEIAAYMEESARQLGEAFTFEREDGILISREGFLKMPSVLQQCRIHQILGQAAGSRKDLTHQHIESVQKLFQMQTGRRLILPYDLEAQAVYDGVLIRKRSALSPSGGLPLDEHREVVEIPPLELGSSVRIELPGAGQVDFSLFTYDGDEKKIPRNPCTKWFDYDKIENGMQIRTRKPGDYLQLTPKGGHKKLKEWLITEKVPAKDRDALYLLASGSHILWIFGYRTSEAFRVDQGSRHILEVRFGASFEDLGGNHGRSYD